MPGARGRRINGDDDAYFDGLDKACFVSHFLFIGLSALARPASATTAVGALFLGGFRRASGLGFVAYTRFLARRLAAVHISPGATNTMTYPRELQREAPDNTDA